MTRFLAAALLGFTLGFVIGLWLDTCNTLPPERVLVRDTLIVRDTVTIRIPPQVRRARLHAKKRVQSSTITYFADTVLQDGTQMQIAFVPDSMLFDITVALPARDTTVPRTLVLERTVSVAAGHGVWGTLTAFLAGVVTGALTILLLAR